MFLTAIASLLGGQDLRNIFMLEVTEVHTNALCGAVPGFGL